MQPLPSSSSCSAPPARPAWRNWVLPARFLKSVAESDAFLKQSTPIDHQIFIDSLAFAHMKPVFKGYDEWSATVGDGMTPIWNGEAELNPTLDEIVIAGGRGPG